MSPDSPGVRFPPPFIFAAGFVVGLLIQRFLPLQLVAGEGTGFLNVAQWALFVAGASLAFWGLLTFFKARTAIIPHRPASQLVTSGPFKYSRNPMYLGLTLMYLGLGIWVNALWPILLLPLSLWALWVLVIQKEERYLASAFGEKYESYHRKVRRWV